jgi:translation initiation factor 2 beta subunit (eIF-2beta)/eIF-5
MDKIFDAMVDESIKNHLKETVRQLALERMMVIKLKVMSEEEVTEFINKYGDEFTKEFQGKSPIDIIISEIKRVQEGQNE